MRHFKIERPDFGQGSTRVNPTGNPRKQFFQKAPQVSSIIQRKNCKIELLSREKCASPLIAASTF